MCYFRTFVFLLLDVTVPKTLVVLFGTFELLIYTYVSHIVRDDVHDDDDDDDVS
jgi:hypothetical protein